MIVVLAAFVWIITGLNQATLAQGALEDELMLPDEENTSKLSLHGYGELHYNSPRGSDVPADDAPASMDFHRMVWGVSYHLNDRISLHTEVDFEHAAQEMELEFAYLDFLVNPAFNFRTGAMLMPVGPLNEYHEPPLFYSVERPYVQRTIIPTTWQEGGIGIFGTLASGLKYRVYLVSGLNSTGFSASSGIRGGRGKVAGGEDKPRTGDELAVVARLEYAPIPGLSLGVTGYQGGANQDTEDALDGVDVTIIEADLRYRIAGFDLRSVYTQINIDEADKVNTFNGLVPGDPGSIGEKLLGWYVEGAYDVLMAFNLKTEKRVVVFVRHEQFNTQEEVPSGYQSDRANDRNVTTFGLAYYPIDQVAFKADFEQWDNEADESGNRFNLGAVYMF